MKKALAVAIILLVVASLVFAGGQKAASGKKLVIFSQCNNAEPYRAAQNASFQQLWAQYPDVQFEIMDAQQDNSTQVSQIETAIRRTPDLLIVAPNERAPLSDVMGRAKRAGIPVICLERDIVDSNNFDTWIMSDNRSIGRLVGEFIVDYLTKKYGSPTGNVVDMQGLLGVEGEENRREGAWDVLKQYPNIKQVAKAEAKWLQSDARDRMTEILRVQPTIDVLYGHNDPMAIGAYLAAQELGREKEMIFIGVDALNGEAGGIKKVIDGVLSASFIYPLCTDKAVEIGYKMISDASFKPEKQYEVTSQMITIENAASLYRP
ncbi:MAG: substrate-binding domain-containing protein [Treponema sp.]|jgi:ribose transport system substrate-binding protein|nr:substrate-binding domain-containing protein [Treponema sp.]